PVAGGDVPPLLRRREHERSGGMTDTTATIPTRPRIAASREPHALLVALPHLIRTHGRGMIFWTLGVTIFSVVVVLAFPAFQDTGALDVSSYPESMREAFNLQSMNTIEPF